MMLKSHHEYENSHYEDMAEVPVTQTLEANQASQGRLELSRPAKLFSSIEQASHSSRRRPRGQLMQGKSPGNARLATEPNAQGDGKAVPLALQRPSVMKNGPQLQGAERYMLRRSKPCRLSQGGSGCGHRGILEAEVDAEPAGRKPALLEKVMPARNALISKSSEGIHKSSSKHRQNLTSDRANYDLVDTLSVMSSMTKKKSLKVLREERAR